MKKIFLISCYCLFLIYSGCAQKQGIDQEKVISELRVENKKLTEENASLSTRINKLQKQLSNIKVSGEKYCTEKPYEIMSINLGKYTGFFDKDEDGIKETLIVYFTPMDTKGDYLKAEGLVKVELWDLETEEENNLIKRWTVTVEDLKDNWFSGMLKTNYRLTFDISSLIDDFSKNYTVRLDFVECLRGQSFKEQMVLKSE